MLLRAAAMTLAFAAAAPALAAPLLEIRGADGAMELSAADIFGVAIADDVNGGKSVHLRLRPPFNRPFAELTAAHVGRPVQVLACGVLLAEPVVLIEMPRAELNLTGTAAELALPLVPALRGYEPCPE